MFKYCRDQKNHTWQRVQETPKRSTSSIKSSKFILQQNGWLTTKRNIDKFSTDCLRPTYMQNFPFSINNLMRQIGK